MPSQSFVLSSAVLFLAWVALAWGQQPPPPAPTPPPPPPQGAARVPCPPAGEMGVRGASPGAMGAAPQREVEDLRCRLADVQHRRMELIEQRKGDQPEYRELTQEMERLEQRLVQLRVGSRGAQARSAGEIWERGATPTLSVPVDAVLERIRQDKPELFDRLVRLRSESPAQFERELPRTVPLPTGLPRTSPGPVLPPVVSHSVSAMPARDVLRSVDPRRAMLLKTDEQLTDQAISLVEQYRRTTEPPRREELVKQIREVLGRQFDTRMELRQADMKDLKQRLDEVTASLEKRAKDKPNLIERRLKQLLNPEEAEW